jgi:hypothetical protein
MGLGVFQALGGLLVQGIWLVLIGWFPNNAARTSYAQLLIRQAIAPLTVDDLMQTRFETVEPEMSIQQFIEEHLLRGSQLAWPVVDGGRYPGLVTLGQAQATSESDRHGKTIGELLRLSGQPLHPQAGGQEALRALAEHDPLASCSAAHRLLGRNDHRPLGSHWGSFLPRGT